MVNKNYLWARSTKKTDTKIGMNFEMMKKLLPLFNEYKSDGKRLKVFFDQNRNGIFDCTASKEFQNGFISSKAQSLMCEGVKKVNFTKDHVIRRVHGIAYLFEVLNENPDMSLDTFRKHLKLIGQQIVITKEEHDMVIKFTRRNGNRNYHVYSQCDIKIVPSFETGGSSDWNTYVKNNLDPIYQKIDYFLN